MRPVQLALVSGASSTKSITCQPVKFMRVIVRFVLAVWLLQMTLHNYHAVTGITPAAYISGLISLHNVRYAGDTFFVSLMYGLVIVFGVRSILF